MLRLPIILAAALVMATGPAHAETADFISTCVEHAGDFTALPEALEAKGMAEIDAATGPQFMPMPGIADRRLWQLPAPVGQKSELYVSLVSLAGDVPLELCFALSPNGENAVTALEMLQRLYPPLPGSRQTGPDVFYGGQENWASTIHGTDYVLGVSWPFDGDPSIGPGTLFIMKPGTPSDPR